MELSEFDYHLPEERIAQEPLPERDASRLLVLERRSGELAHHLFRDLPGLLEPDDLVVFNDVKVIPARIYGAKERTGGKVECLLLERRDCDRQKRALGLHGQGSWPSPKGFGHPVRRRSARGGRGEGEGGPGSHPILSIGSDVFATGLNTGDTSRFPPTSVASTDPRTGNDTKQSTRVRMGPSPAPTAGLHFTTRVLNDIKERGIEQATVTLHIGAGTFRPIRIQRIANHRMDPGDDRGQPGCGGPDQQGAQPGSTNRCGGNVGRPNARRPGHERRGRGARRIIGAGAGFALYYARLRISGRERFGDEFPPPLLHTTFVGLGIGGTRDYHPRL